MNIQGSNMVERRSVRKSDVSYRWVAAVSKGLLVLGCIGIMANTYIYFTQKITETDRQILQLKKELANVEREIDSYRLQYEKYSACSNVNTIAAACRSLDNFVKEYNVAVLLSHVHIKVFYARNFALKNSKFVIMCCE